MPYIDKQGVYRSDKAKRSLLTSSQWKFVAVIGILVGPAYLRRAWQTYRDEKGVDLSSFNIKADPFETPALEKKDGKVRIEFCSS